MIAHASVDAEPSMPGDMETQPSGVASSPGAQGMQANLNRARNGASAQLPGVAGPAPPPSVVNVAQLVGIAKEMQATGHKVPHSLLGAIKKALHV